jgi:glutamine synthetase
MDFLLALQLLQQQFILERELYPLMGAELEFYLLDAHGKPASLALENALALMPAGFGATLEAERGTSQYELIFPPHENAALLAGKLEKIKQAIEQNARSAGLTASFAAKPLDDQPGSGLHLHLSLSDALGNNQFYKRGDEVTPLMMQVIGGLLAALPESVRVFAPYAASYARFSGSQDAPTKICWGMNNRTTALRVPESISGYRHIEHRVPGADAPPTAAMLAILGAALHGIRHRITPPEPVFGNAFLPQYALPLLPQNIVEATKIYHSGGILEEFFGNGWQPFAE